MSWKKYIYNIRELISNESFRIYKKIDHDQSWQYIQYSYKKKLLNKTDSFFYFRWTDIFYGFNPNLKVSLGIMSIFFGVVVSFFLFSSDPGPYLVPEYIKGNPQILVQNKLKKIHLGEKIEYPVQIVTGMYDQVGFSLYSKESISEKKQISVQSNSVIMISRNELILRTLPFEKESYAQVITRVYIKKGSSAARIEKLSGQEKFFIENPISSVEARGTSYMVSYEPISRRTGIILKEGKIKILEKNNESNEKEKNEMILNKPSMVQIERLPAKSIWTTTNNIPDPYVHQLRKIYARFSPSLLDYSSRDVTGRRAEKIKNSILFGVFSNDLKFSPVYYRKLIGAVSKDNLLRVLFLDSSNQRLLWEKKLSTGILTKPVITDNYLVYISEDGYLRALNIATGRQKYKTKVVVSQDAFINLIKTYHPVWDNMILVESDNQISYYISHTGKRIWSKRKEVSEKIYTLSRDELLLYNKNGKISAIYLYTGDILWSTNTQVSLQKSYFCEDPWMLERFYIVTRKGNLIAVNKENGKILFQKNFNGEPITNPYITPGTIQVFTRDSVLRVMNKKGMSIWEKNYQKQGGHIRISHIGPFVFVVGKTYVHKYSMENGSLLDSWHFLNAKEIFLSPGMDYIIVSMDSGRILTQKM